MGDDGYQDVCNIKQFVTKANNNLSFLNINIRSLNKNLDKLELLLDELKFDPDIIGVTETWINETRPLLFSLDNYNFVNEPSPGRVGGVGFFIKRGIEFNILSKYQLHLENCEDIWLELFLKNKKKTNSWIRIPAPIL